MTIDLAAVHAGQVRYADLMRQVRHADLYEMTDELFDALELILAGSTDAALLFVPRDPAAKHQNEPGWTLSHVVAHLTATLEEAATVATLLARGVQVEERLHSETPWQKLSTFQAAQARLQESRRTCRAFLDAWPDKPHLDVTRTLIPLFGPMDAIGFYAFGIAHAQEHLCTGYLGYLFQNRAVNGKVSTSIALCLMYHWSEKGLDSVICGSFFERISEVASTALSGSYLQMSGTYT